MLHDKPGWQRRISSLGAFHSYHSLGAFTFIRLVVGSFEKGEVRIAGENIRRIGKLTNPTPL
jgi:hypothetical protein